MAKGEKKPPLEEMAAAKPQPAPDFAGADDGPADQEGPRLPTNSPVKPLGVQGTKIHFLDQHNQLQSVNTECRKGDLFLWFGEPFLVEHFPQEGRGQDRFDQRAAQAALIEDCNRKGIFDPLGKVFGRGAHRAPGDESQLVLHMGRRVMIANAPTLRGPRNDHAQEHPAGLVKINGRDAYFPALAALPAPAAQTATTEDARALLDLFKRWNWVDPKAAPLLLLGMVMQMFICGALDWRAHCWMPGPTASGKSSLQKRIRALMDEWCLHTADSSEAAIRQILGNDTLAVSIDEAEAHDNPERLHNVLNLMKKSSSGDQILRGGADHKGQAFTARSAFLLSSVLHAPLRAEDRNRIVLLELRTLPEDAEPLEMELARWQSVGRRLHRRMVEQWPRWEATLAAYKREIGSQRFVGRWQDTYGTLLACADLALYDLLPHHAEELQGDQIEKIAEPGMSRIREAVTTILPLMAKGRAEAKDDVERVVSFLLSQSLPGESGRAPETVGVWLDRAMTSMSGQEAFGSGEATSVDPEVNEKARARLMAHGMKCVRLVPKGRRDEVKEGLTDALVDDAGWRQGYLAVAYGTHAGIDAIFRRPGSDWVGGAWTQSLKKVPGARAGHKVRFGSQDAHNAVLVPLEAFRSEEG